MARAQWNSKIGFVLASCGATVGLGSIWKFPYVAANNGGGAFILIFTLITLTLGLSLLLAEIAIGRAASCGAVGAFRKLGSKYWSIVGFIGVLCGFLVLSFYSVVGGWTIGYLLRSFDGRVMHGDLSTLEKIFSNYVSNPIEPIVTHAIFLLLTLLIVMSGIQKGIERASKFLMPTLFFLIVFLIFRSLTLPNASIGLINFIYPDFSKVTTRMLVDALGLAFFSLSVGAGCMLAYGSYLDNKVKLKNSALWISFLTIISSVLAGLMIFPALTTFGLKPTAGPGLSYITMPVIFYNLPFGQIFAIAFFSLLVVASLTSAVSLLELTAIYFIDEFKMTRRKATSIISFFAFLIGIPVSLSFGVIADFKIFNLNFFELLDYITSNLLLPIGGIGISLFTGWKAWEVIKRELEFSPLTAFAMEWMCKLIAPILIGFILIYNI
ncbi:sodium-dependent transporter [Pigmentibacter ruber]